LYQCILAPCVKKKAFLLFFSTDFGKINRGFLPTGFVYKNRSFNIYNSPNPHKKCPLLYLKTHVQGVESQAFDFPDNFLEIVALTLKFVLRYQYVADSP
jgi:hypothetical protein